MKPVIQQEATGCAIASAAALAGVSYAAAKRVAASLCIHAGDPGLWSDTAHIRRLLKHYQIRTNAEQTPFKNWAALPDHALLAIKWHKENGIPYWHWVVFVREANGEEYVLDSKKALKRNRRTDFGRIRPKWFIGVTP
ncbi:MAG TPA: hypothetical protein ENI97_10350 [Gammaproteobacteria bacterium]|nr:hypothetical protein [Gammaproteobacteria bacterium]